MLAHRVTRISDVLWTCSTSVCKEIENGTLCIHISKKVSGSGFAGNRNLHRHSRRYNVYHMYFFNFVCGFVRGVEQHHLAKEIPSWCPLQGPSLEPEVTPLLKKCARLCL